MTHLGALYLKKSCSNIAVELIFHREGDRGVEGNDMEFKLVELIKYPLDAVYDTYRDHLADLVSYLPNVERIEKLEQQATPNGVKQLNRWKVSGAIPRPLRAFFSDQLLTYLDHADWNDSERHVEWRFEMGMMTEAIDCHGTNFFRGVSENSTELTLTGELTIDLSKIRAIPRFLYGLAPTFEKFIFEPGSAQFHFYLPRGRKIFG